ncbi:membrane progestin receptor beta [Aplysia californica]|uniref:Membrane progestin receptor beta n=1 Tax=Aplysia californica TaxID=6500 RepID=A0ABM0JEJ2_APLCA|nr:membrane progestin receptor beta [Aplysia californica]
MGLERATIDYYGVGQYSLGRAFLIIYVSMNDDVFPISATHWLLLICVLLSWTDFVCCVISQLKFHRPYPLLAKKLWQVVPFVVHGAFFSFLIAPRVRGCLTSPDCHMFWDQPGLYYIFLELIAGAICILTFSSHMPEKIWPGTFDFLGQGHQIFHVASVTMTMFQFESGAADAVQYYRAEQARPELWDILAAILLLKLACLTTIVCLKNKTLDCVRKESDMKSQ